MPEEHKRRHRHEHQWADPGWKEWIWIALIFIVAMIIAVKIWSAFIAVTTVEPTETTHTPFRQHVVMTGGK